MTQEGIKYCGRCRKHLPRKAFNKDKRRKGGLRYACRKCNHVAKLAYSASDRGRTRQWAARLKRRYNITPKDYNAMLEAQGGVCAACGNHPEGLHLNVDHNHATGRVRGLLCSSCNLALGNVYEDIKILEGLVSYIREYD